MNFTSISKIRSRIISLIDLVLIQFSQDQSISQYGLDQAKLQQWCYLLKDLVIQKQDIIQPVKLNSKSVDKYQKITLHKITKMSTHFECSKLLDVIDSKKLIVYSKNQQTKNQFHFNQGSLRRFSSVVQVSQDKFIIAGGCHFSNPTLKSANISLFESKTGQIKKVSELIQAISSHSSLFINPRVYFIGGKKNEGVITKMCSYFDIYKKQVNQIAALNYPAASMCTIKWKNQFIYKVGGFGESFGQWSVSPYIQRYNIEQDQWEVINPYIPQHSINNFSNFQLYAHSLGYITHNNQLIIFGGFDLNKKGTKFGCIIQIKSLNQDGSLQNDQQQQQDIHEIVKFGQIQGLQPGGFWNSQFILDQDNNIHAVQTVMNPKLQTKLIKIRLQSRKINL